MNYSNLNDLRFLKNLLIEKEQDVLTNYINDVLEEANLISEETNNSSLTDNQRLIIERFNNIIENYKLDINDKGEKSKIIEIYYNEYNLKKRTAQDHFNKVYSVFNKPK